MIGSERKFMGPRGWSLIPLPGAGKPRPAPAHPLPGLTPGGGMSYCTSFPDTLSSSDPHQPGMELNAVLRGDGDP